MATSLQRVVFMAIVASLLAAANAADLSVMSISNDFPSAKLFVRCDSDIAHQSLDILPPHAAHLFTFSPDAHRFWMCSIYTSAPPVHGRFTLFARELDPRLCSPVCDWKANDAGVWLTASPGEKPTLIYPW